MTSRPFEAVLHVEPAIRWTRALAPLHPDPAVEGWLTEPGLVTERVRRHCGGEFGLRVVDERHDVLSAADAAALGVTDLSAFVREIELTCDDTACVFAQTLVPAATLAAEPWLALLGRDAIGSRLASLGGAVRDPLEFARLTPSDALFARAARDLPVVPPALWARRARYRLATHCLVVQEVFLPGALS
ncbi:MAG: chorismate lyase [Proteobacteria bacterium]|nr:chorismate lyase [Pseudomonadota bacterium]